MQKLEMTKFSFLTLISDFNLYPFTYMHCHRHEVSGTACPLNKSHLDMCMYSFIIFRRKCRTIITPLERGSQGRLVQTSRREMPKFWGLWTVAMFGKLSRKELVQNKKCFLLFNETTGKDMTRCIDKSHSYLNTFIISVHLINVTFSDKSDI